MQIRLKELSSILHIKVLSRPFPFTIHRQVIRLHNFKTYYKFFDINKHRLPVSNVALTVRSIVCMFSSRWKRPCSHVACVFLYQNISRNNENWNEIRNKVQSQYLSIIIYHTFIFYPLNDYKLKCGYETPKNWSPSAGKQQHDRLRTTKEKCNIRVSYLCRSASSTNDMTKENKFYDQCNRMSQSFVGGIPRRITPLLIHYPCHQALTVPTTSNIETSGINQCTLVASTIKGLGGISRLREICGRRPWYY